MISLLLRLGGWITRNLLTIVVSIALCTLVLHTMAELNQLRQSIGTVEEGRAWLRSYPAQLEEQANARMRSLKGLGSAALDQKISAISIEIAQRQASVKAIGLTLTPSEAVKKARLKLEIEALGRLRAHTERTRDYVFADEALARRKTECLTKNAAIQNALPTFETLDAEVAAFTTIQEVQASLNPASDKYQTKKRRDKLEQSIVDESEKVRNICNLYVAEKRKQDASPRVGAVAFQSGWSNNVMAELDRYRAQLQSRVDTHWLERAKRAVSDEAQGPYAKQATKYVVFGAIGAAAAWVLIRVLFYFVLAPAAARSAPIRLLPSVDGCAELLRRPRSTEASGGEGPSTSLTVDLKPGQLLAIQSEYFHGASSGCTISTRSVVNRRYLRASLAAGLYNLTDVEVQSPATVTVSAGHEPLQQLAVLDIPSDSAVTIQPDHVIGAIHRRETPVTITRHLRLFNLQSWLTLRFRYLVFHGPVQLILKGCRGIKLEAVDVERTIDRAYSIGFSANLSFGVVETETFAAYVTSKKRLLRDRFRGGPGVLICEESPSGSKRKRSRQRGLEDLADSAVNVAGAVTGAR